VNYAVDGVARRGVGDTWLVDYFAVGTSNARYGLAADRVTIHTPEGTTVTNRPARASVDGNAATWTRAAASTGRRASPTAAAASSGRRRRLLRDDRPRCRPDGTLPRRQRWARSRTTDRNRGNRDHSHRLGSYRLRCDDARAADRGRRRPSAQAASSSSARCRPVTDSRREPSRWLRSESGTPCWGARRAGRRATRDSRVRRSVGARDGRRRRGHPPARWAAGVRVSRAVRPGDRALSPDRARRRTRGRTAVALIAVAALTPIAAIAAVAPVPSSDTGRPSTASCCSPWVASVAVFGYPLALLGRRLAIDTD